MTKLRDTFINDEEIAGLYGHFLNEGPFIPLYKETGGEKIHAGNNNSFIILGRDRDGHGGEGYGGLGATGCGSIDLIVGLGGQDYKQFVKKQIQKGVENKASFSTEKRKTDPSFIRDAARIYITEMGHIDNYFGLAQGSEMVNQSAFKSAVGVKADHVRIVGREHVKIVTGKMRLEGGGTHGEKNSGDQPIEFAGKIDLIAGNYTDPENNSLLSIFGDTFTGEAGVRKLQPIPKGDNLRVFLDMVLDMISELSNMIIRNGTTIGELISLFQAHVHEFNVPFGPTSPPIAAGVAAVVPTIKVGTGYFHAYFLTYEIITHKIMYLMPLFSTYINSRFVNTT